MAELETIADALRLAIIREGHACEFYKQLALHVQGRELHDLVLLLAQEELEHKRRLEFELVKQGVVTKEVPAEVRFSVAEYLKEPGSPEGLDYKEVMLLAIEKERTSFRLYALLAGVVEDEEMQEGLLAMAEEEAKHILRFEEAYREATSNQG
jgi:rubrerythrin